MRLRRARITTLRAVAPARPAPAGIDPLIQLNVPVEVIGIGIGAVATARPPHTVRLARRSGTVRAHRGSRTDPHGDLDRGGGPTVRERSEVHRDRGNRLKHVARRAPVFANSWHTSGTPR